VLSEAADDVWLSEGQCHGKKKYPSVGVIKIISTGRSETK
jgi:hypothetical protein